MEQGKVLGVKAAVIRGSNGSERKIVGALQLTTAPFGVELGRPFLVEVSSGTVFPMESVVSVHR